MPSLDLIPIVEKLDDADNDLRRDNGDAGGQGDPTNCVDGAANITLYRTLSELKVHLPFPKVLTSSFLAETGAIR